MTSFNLSVPCGCPRGTFLAYHYYVVEAGVFPDMQERKDKREKEKPSRVPPLIQKLLEYDAIITKKLSIHASRSSAISANRDFWKAVEWSGHGLIWFAGLGALIWIAPTESLRCLFLNLLLSCTIDLMSVALWKAVTRRRRPSQDEGDMFGVVSVDKFSFPSGHVTRAVMVTCLLHQHTESLLFTALLSVWCLTVIASRVLLGRHHLGDVLGGAVIGYIQYLLISFTMWMNPQTCFSVLHWLSNDGDHAVAHDPGDVIFDEL